MMKNEGNRKDKIEDEEEFIKLERKKILKRKK